MNKIPNQFTTTILININIQWHQHTARNKDEEIKSQTLRIPDWCIRLHEGLLLVSANALCPIITLTSQLIFFMICSSLWFTLLSIKPSTNIKPSNNIDFDTSTRRLSFSGSKSPIFGHCISFIWVWFLSSYGFVCIGKLQGSVGFEGILI